MKQNIERVEKPWGYELIWAKTKDYVGKVLHINKGHKLSLQYHKEKEETIFLQSGKMEFLIEEPGADGKPAITSVILNPGDSYHTPVGRIHRMIALEDCDVFEVSTPQLHDVVRLDDSYGRTS